MTTNTEKKARFSREDRIRHAVVDLAKKMTAQNYDNFVKKYGISPYNTLEGWRYLGYWKKDGEKHEAYVGLWTDFNKLPDREKAYLTENPKAIKKTFDADGTKMVLTNKNLYSIEQVEQRYTYSAKAETMAKNAKIEKEVEEVK